MVKIIDNFLAKFGYLKKEAKEAERKEIKKEKKEVTIPETFLAPIYQAIPPQKKASDYLEAASSWVYACVSAIADEVASINFHLYQKKSDNSIEEISQHELLDLLYRVNNFTTKFDHFWLTQVYLELVGEAPWLLEKVGGKINNIFLLRPDKLEIIYDEKKIIGGYKYQVNYGKKIRLEPEEVIFLKYPNPTKPFRGRGTLEACAKTVDIDEFSEEWNRKFFYNSAEPAAVLETEGNLSDEQIKRLRTQWVQRYQGLDNAHKLAILEGGLKYKERTRSQKDMDFTEQMKAVRDKILGIFRVPRTVLGITDDVNRANAEATDYVFARRTIKPKMQRIVEQLNEFLVPYYGDNLFLDFDNPVPQDMEKKYKGYESGVRAGWLTINEVRKEEGRLPVSGGDSVYMPLNIMPIGSVEKPKKRYRPREKYISKAKEKPVDLKKQLKELIKNQLIKNKKKELDEKRKEKIWKLFVKRTDVREKKYIDLVNSFFKKQEKKVLDNLKGKSIKGVRDVLFNKKEEMNILIEIVLPFMKEMVEKEGKEAMRNLTVDQEFELTPSASNKILGYTKRSALEINQTTWDKLKKTLEKGIEEGEGMDKLAKRIKDVYKEATTTRAKKIARTEVIKSSNYASEEAYKQSGVVVAKEWLTALDERTCPACMEMNGKIVGLDKDYLKKGDEIAGLKLDYEDIKNPPLHAQCRCTTIPVLRGQG